MSTHNNSGAYLGVIKESTWDTAPGAATNFVRISPGTGSISESFSYVPVDVFAAGDTFPGHRESFAASNIPSWVRKWPVAYNDSSMSLFYMAMGSESTAAAGGGGGSNRHTIVCASTLPSFTMHHVEGVDQAGALNGRILTGAKASELLLEYEAGGLLMATLTGIGGTLAAPTSSVTAYSDATSRAYIKASHAAAVSWNSQTYNVERCSLRYANGLTALPYAGSTGTLEPVIGSVPVLEVSATLVWNDNNLETAWAAGTTSDLAITFSGTGNHQLVLTGESCQVYTLSKSAPGHGPRRQEVTWRAHFNGTDYFSAAFDNAVTDTLDNSQ